MFRLPVCPHCKTVYRYKDTKKEIKLKQDTCYHCKKEFKASIFPGILVGGGILTALCIVINILLLFRMRELQIWLLFLITLLFILLIYLVIPFFTVFKKTETQNTKTNNKKKIQK